VPEEFSLLLPVWAGDRPDFLAAAFRSSVQDQTRPPGEVVIVRDGPVPPALAETLADLAAGSPVPVRLLELPATAVSAPRSMPGWPPAPTTWSPAWTPTTCRCRTASPCSCP
jgi:hypothetical protein